MLFVCVGDFHLMQCTGSVAFGYHFRAPLYSLARPIKRCRPRRNPRRGSPLRKAWSALMTA